MHYVVSDIHGYWSWFVRMFGLDRNPGKIDLQTDDQVYIIGDCADRGPHGVRIWNYVRSDPRFHLILGNHELMAIESFRNSPKSDDYCEIWLRNGGTPTRDAMLAMPDQDREDLLSWLESLPEWLDLDIGGKSYRLVHAGWSDFDQDIRLWERPSPYKLMICQGRDLIIGHTPVCYLYSTGPSGYLSKCGRHMKIYKNQYFICIDCGCGHVGIKQQALACLRLDDAAEFYVTADDPGCADPMKL